MALKKLNNSGSPEKAFDLALNDTDVMDVLHQQSVDCDCAERARDRVETLLGTPGPRYRNRISDSQPCRKTCSTIHNPVFHSARSGKAFGERPSSAESHFIKRSGFIDW